MTGSIQGISVSEDGAALQTTYFDLVLARNVTKEVAGLCKFCGKSDSFSLVTRGMFPKPSKWAIVVGGTIQKPIRFYICNECCKMIVHRV